MLVGSCLGILIGTLMIKIAYDHNPQGAVHDTLTGKIDVVYLAEIFLSWFIVGLLFVIGCYLIFFLVKKIA